MRNFDFSLRNAYQCILISILILCSSQVAHAVNITFRVDMHGIKTTEVFVGSDWAGWDPAKFQQLTDTDKDSIYEITIDLPAGASYNYRYKFGARDWNNFEDLSNGTCGAGPKKQDRNIVVPTSATVLPIYCFSACSDCMSVLRLELKLSVDMKGLDISSDGVHVTGTFNGWDPGSLKMDDPDGDGIYTISIPAVSGGIYEYKFLNGNKWGTEELVFGTCEFRSNRIASVADASLTMPVVKFNYCSDSSEPTKDIKIACIGNSITQGGGTLTNVYTKNWPVQLRDLLGKGYYTENLGVSGRTLLKSGDYPWWNEAQYQYTFKFQPDIVLIKLGTNDSKPYNWNAVKYKTDYLALIDSLRKMKNPPLIYISTPAKAYSSAFDISDNVISSEIIPILREVSKEKMVALIDMYKATTGMSSDLPDGIHPNDNGAKVIATKFKEAISNQKPTIVSSESAITAISDNNYNWYFNGKLIANSNTQSIEIKQDGTYQLAIKAQNSDDISISEPYSANLTATGKASLFLSTKITTSTNYVSDIDNKNIMVYPNPTQNSLSLECKNLDVTSVGISNQAGQMMNCKFHLSESNKYIADVSSLSTGVYFILIETKQKKEYQVKFVKN